jgi:sigma-E factor negative regulatory protein RseC
MIETHADVLAVEPDCIVIQAKRQTGCQSCQSQSGCGTSSLAKLFHIQTLVLRLNKPQIPLQAGDTVVIGTDEALFVHQTLWTYLPAMLGFLGGLSLAAWLDASVVGQVALASLGVWLGFRLTRHHLKHHAARYLPQILKKME